MKYGWVKYLGNKYTNYIFYILDNTPSSPAISNCGYYTGNICPFINYFLQANSQEELKVH